MHNGKLVTSYISASPECLQPINEHESTDKYVSRKTALDIISKIHIFASFINADM